MDALFLMQYTEMLFYLDEAERADLLRKMDDENTIMIAYSDRARRYARQFVNAVFDQVKPIPCKRGKTS